MARSAGLVLIMFSGILPASLLLATDEPEDDRKAVMALERVMKKAIQDASPSIACILVSRSDAYQRFGSNPDPENPGKLGSFDAASLDLPGLSNEEKSNLRKKLDLADPAHVPESFGSGVVIHPSGLILTNYHVVRDAARVFVRLPGNKSSYADIHAADPRSDLAVLRLLRPGLDLKAISLGDADTCAKGQLVLTIGNPFVAGFRDNQPCSSWGILGNIRRRVPGPPHEDKRGRSFNYYRNLLQTDAKLHLGFSGGALINLKGEIIGLTNTLVAIRPEAGGEFAIPIDANIRAIIEVLKRGEEVEYGFLGVGFDEGRAKNGGGVVLTRVLPGSPAERQAQLRTYDRLLAVDGQPLQEGEDLLVELGTRLAGSTIKLRVQRVRGPIMEVQATLAKIYVPGKAIFSSLGKRPFFRGLRVDYTSVLDQMIAWRVPPGVSISQVQAKSPAANTNLKVGEIITQVNGRPVNSPVEFYREINGQKGPVELTLSGSGPNEPRPKVILK